MAFRLPRLRPEFDITEGNKASGLFRQWWQSVVGSLETQIDDLTAVVDGLSGVEGSITGLQPYSTVLDGVVALGTDEGIVQKTGANAFETLPMGTGSPDAVPTTLDADARYLQSGGALTASAATTTHKLAVTISGTTYYILLSNV